MLDFLTGFIGMVAYPLFSVIFVFIDVLQAIFYSLAGIGGKMNLAESGSYWGTQDITTVNDGGEYSTGLIFALLNHQLVKNLLISITILALFLLIIFTVMAFIKNAYAAKQKTWQEIIGNALKGLINFVFVPVCCLLGVWVSNIILIAINGATSSGGSVSMSRKLFICCAYNANEYRQNTNFDGKTDPTKAIEIYKDVYGVEPEEAPANYTDEQKMEYYANLIDMAYSETDSSKYNVKGIHWYWNVSPGYGLASINYITLVVGGVFILYVLVSLAYAMVRRIFILLMLFVISPALCAMYPLDEGNAVGQWKKNFISTTIGAYGAVAGMNIFFSLLPLIDQIGFATSMAATSFTDSIIQLLMMVCGLFVVKEMMQMISGYIGGDDAFSKGTSLRASTKKTVRDWGNKAIGGAFRLGSSYNTAYSAARGPEEARKHRVLASIIRGFYTPGAKDPESGKRGEGSGLLSGKGLGGLLYEASGIKETFKVADSAIQGVKKKTEHEETVESLLKDLIEVQKSDSDPTKNVNGKSGMWTKNASLEDLLKIADKLGLKTDAAKKAGLNVDVLKSDQELLKSLTDAVGEINKTNTAMGKFKTQNASIMSSFGASTIDDLASKEITEDMSEAKRNAILTAQSLVERRDEAFKTYAKSYGAAKSGVMTTSLQVEVTEIGQKMTKGKALKDVTDSDGEIGKIKNDVSATMKDIEQEISDNVKSAYKDINTNIANKVGEVANSLLRKIKEDATGGNNKK